MTASITAVVVDLGCLMPGRYARVAAYAEHIGVDPVLFTALFAGVTWPETAPAMLAVREAATDNHQFAEALAMRVAADRGQASWAAALAAATSAFEAVWGVRWDASGYLQYLTSGSGPALHLARSHALVELATHIPVVCVATSPRELAKSAADVFTLPLPVQVSCHLGACRPDPDVWRRALAQASPHSHWSQTMVVVDLTASLASIDADTDPPAEAWWVNDAASEQSWLHRVANLP